MKSVIGAELAGDRKVIPVGERGAAGHGNNFELRQKPFGFGDEFEAVHVIHEQICDEHVGGAGPQLMEGFTSVRARDDEMTGAGERVFQESANQMVVVNYQDRTHNLRECILQRLGFESKRQGRLK